MTSNPLRLIPVALIVAVIVAGGYLLAVRTVPAAATPNFAAVTPPAARKEAFMHWLAPVVEQENRRLEPVRQRLVRLQRKNAAGHTLSPQELAYLTELAARYKTASPDDDPGPTLSALLRRVDKVPARLALVQAAVESGWGTGRFAREANNYFGIWTWRHGGLVPERRAEGAKHTVAAYPDAAASVRAYLFTLDAGAAYSELRRLRAEARDAGEEPRASDLAAGLVGYSQRGLEYVAEIQQMLRVNAGLLDTVLEGH